MSAILDYAAPFQSEFKINTQSVNRDNVHPVQILVPSANGERFQLNEDGLRSVLGDPNIQNKKVVIISVAGAFRKGKSFLLNFFLEYLYALQKFQLNGTPLDWLGEDTTVHGFHWRSGTRRDTIGIWMWGEPIIIKDHRGEELAVVVMDTQGAFDNQSVYKECTTIFALSTIVSSLQIYNVVDAIQEDALQNLTLFIEYGRLAMQHAEQIGTPFQSLCFCVRDFKAPEDFPFGKEGGRRYMAQVLSTPPGQASELREPREQLASCFKQLHCYLLPHPGHRVAESSDFHGEVKELRSEFQEVVRKMAESLLSPAALEPKIINGRTATCKTIMRCFKEYVDTFASSSILMPKNILQANARILNSESIEKSKAVYCEAMDRAMGARSILSERKLLKAHIRSEKAALKAYKLHPKIATGEVDEQDNLQKLKEIIDVEFERYKLMTSLKKEQGRGNNLLLGVGLGVGVSGAVAGTALAALAGVGTGGLVAIPAISMAAIAGVGGYVLGKKKLEDRFSSRARSIPLLASFRRNK